MSEKPILFSTEMVRAILDGRKTQTRRVLKAESHGRSPYGVIGGTLWVRETWGLYDTEPKDGPEKAMVFYRASDGENYELRYQLWRPSIFMPRWASRITLRITNLWVERLQDITPASCKAEGICISHPISPSVDEALSHMGAYHNAFIELWDSINAKRGYSWESNPWVWVISFEQYPGGE